jgi:predicted deacylase
VTAPGSADGPITILGETVPPGTHRRLDLDVGRLPSGHQLSMPVEVVHGRRPGPALWLSGAIHGDELVGIEIIRHVLNELEADQLSGLIVAAPVVNVFGFVFQSRYLPDRRDLNRSFPGSATGSLAARSARLFMDKVVAICDVGIDFHAGSDSRSNLPQIRGNMEDPETRRLALAFGAPVAIHAKPPGGSLRAAALKRGKTVLLFEGGEPARFNPPAVEAGVGGTLRALTALGMLEGPRAPPPGEVLMSRATRWTRAPRGGIIRLDVSLGERVQKGDRVGVISDPLVRGETQVFSRSSGIVIGVTVNPLVSLGDAVVHVADVGA